MPLSRLEKEQLLERYGADLAEARNAFVVGFRGISVPQVTELRSKVRESGGRYLVVKNTLLLRAVAGKALEDLGEHFDGPTAVVYGDGDPVALAKVLTDFAKDLSVLEFKAGLVEGRRVSGDDIPEIAKLPSREELIAKLLFLLQAPISRLVRVLGTIPQQLAVVLAQVRDRKQSE